MYIKSCNMNIVLVEIVLVETVLKYGSHNKSFILNAPLVSCPIPVIHSGWVQQQTNPKRMTGLYQFSSIQLQN
jgi:hypothetical protein